MLSDDASPPPTPSPTAEQQSSVEEVGAIGTVAVTADLFDSRSADDNGCDPSGCKADLTRVRVREPGGVVGGRSYFAGWNWLKSSGFKNPAALARNFLVVSPFLEFCSIHR